jgi:uncharacterized delta-60 repeat protein
MRKLCPLLVHLCLMVPAISVKAQSPGALDPGFNPEAAFSDVFWAMAVQLDGKIVAAGRQGASYGVVYRLKPDGTTDPAFQSGARATCLDATVPQINAVALQTNGSILLGGQFTYFDEPSRLRLAQLNPFGLLDPAFTPSANDSVLALAVQADGKILIGGNFTNFKGSGKNYLVRLAPDGSLDETFNTEGAGPSGKVLAVAIDLDGSIMIGGEFTGINGIARSHVGRLRADGGVDTAFDPGSPGINNTVTAVAIQSDHKVVIGGSFTSVAGATVGRIARLNGNGSLDSSFDPGTGCDNYTVWALAIQANGKILAGGRFTSVNQVSRSKIVRFDSNGALDSSFDPDAGAGTTSSDEIRAMKLQPDGKIIVAGKFTVFSGQSRLGVARLFGDPVAELPQVSVHVTSTNLILDWAGAGQLQSATNLAGEFFDVPGATNPPWAVTNSLPVEFFRVRK